MGPLMHSNTPWDRVRIGRAAQEVREKMCREFELLSRAANPITIHLYPKGSGFDISFGVSIEGSGRQVDNRDQRGADRMGQAIQARMVEDTALLARALGRITIQVEPVGNDFDVKFLVKR